MSCCGNCKFNEWCPDKAEDIKWCIEKSHLNIAYEQGRADGYSQAENDYHKQTEKDRKSSYDCGYEQGKAEAIDEIDNILNADMTISEVLAYLIRFIDKAKGRNRNDLDREKSV